MADEISSSAILLFSEVSSFAVLVKSGIPSVEVFIVEIFLGHSKSITEALVMDELSFP